MISSGPTVGRNDESDRGLLGACVIETAAKQEQHDNGCDKCADEEERTHNEPVAQGGIRNGLKDEHGHGRGDKERAKWSPTSMFRGRG